MPTTFDDWVRGLIVGPMPLVERTLAERSRRREQEAEAEREATREQGRTTRARENILLNIREQARVRQEAKDREEAASQGRLKGLMGVLNPPPSFGVDPEGPSIPGPVPSRSPTLEDVLPHMTEKGRETALQKRFAPEVIERDVSRPLVEKLTGREISPSLSVPPRQPVAFEDYNPVTQEPKWNEAKKRWDITNRTVTDMELLAAEAAAEHPKDERKQRQYILAQSLIRQKEVAGLKAGAQASATFPYKPLTELEQQDLDWIQAGKSFLGRFDEYTPEQLKAVTTLPGWLSGKTKTLAKGMLPGIFGAPGATEEAFAKLNALMGEAESLAFAKGGKQLTPMEKETVMAFVPSRGDLINPVVLRSKLNNLKTSLEVIEPMRMWRLNTPRGKLSAEAYDMALKDALAKAGIQPQKSEAPVKPKTAPTATWRN